MMNQSLTRICECARATNVHAQDMRIARVRHVKVKVKLPSTRRQKQGADARGSLLFPRSPLADWACCLHQHPVCCTLDRVTRTTCCVARTSTFVLPSGSKSAHPQGAFLQRPPHQKMSGQWIWTHL